MPLLKLDQTQTTSDQQHPQVSKLKDSQVTLHCSNFYLKKNKNQRVLVSYPVSAILDPPISHTAAASPGYASRHSQQRWDAARSQIIVTNYLTQGITTSCLFVYTNNPHADILHMCYQLAIPTASRAFRIRVASYGYSRSLKLKLGSEQYVQTLFT
jgi:hypothetical protein